MNKKKRTGVYLGADVILRNPDYVKVLRDELSLNLVIISFSGQVSQDVLKTSPFDGVPLSDECLHSLVCRHLDGQPVDPREFDWVRQSVGPSLRIGGDDATMRRAIRLAHEAGVEVWICGGAWTERRLMFCPSDEAVNHWYETVYVYWATEYGVEGVDISHARYPMGSMPRGMFSCTCERCARAATDTGYDMEEMKAALRAGLERLREVDARLLATACRQGMGPFDFMQILGMRSGIIDWFRFRSELLTKNLKRFHEAVRRAAGPDAIFGTDTYPASLSMVVGHNHAKWAEFSDFASPLVSHIHAFVVNTFVEWATFLQEVNPSLSETEALQVVYRLTGYDGMGLPDTVAGYRLDTPERLPYILPLKDLIMRDLIKARLSLPAELPSYPIIHGEGWPREAILGIMTEAEEVGHDGVMLQGTRELVEFELK
jgi:hypothetical protein